MKIRRLRVTDFGTIREADIEFGPGLNVLYGPNDLGKSTLGDAIRLALLLPHTSSYIEDYVPWTGGQNPVVEMTFETEAQRIWRVRKEFRKGGTAILQESKNGVDFDEVERARSVDAKLREILCWGMPEPGGTGGGTAVELPFDGTAIDSRCHGHSVQKLEQRSHRQRQGSHRGGITGRGAGPLFVSLLRDTGAPGSSLHPEGNQEDCQGKRV
jgi:hypothetical protein